MRECRVPKVSPSFSVFVTTSVKKSFIAGVVWPFGRFGLHLSILSINAWVAYNAGVAGALGQIKTEVV